MRAPAARARREVAERERAGVGPREHRRRRTYGHQKTMQGHVSERRRCLEHLWFDVKHHGTRYRMPVNDFAVPRMERPGSGPWNRWRRCAIGSGCSSARSRPDAIRGSSRPARKADRSPARCRLLDAYFERHLRPAGIRSLDTAAGRIKVLKQYFGDLPVKALEEPAVINRFKTESGYARRVEISTLHKVLAILRAAIRWGQAQTPPLIDKSPFHRFGVRLNTKAETVRDRRISRDEEKRLLDAAMAMNTWEHR